MKWYYDGGNGQRQGPVSEAELDALLEAGSISTQTLVWNDTMSDWAPLSKARAKAPALFEETERCDSCGNFVPLSELIQIDERHICATCKPGVIRQLEQGGQLPSASALDRDGPAWERLEQIGFFKAVGQTLKSVLLSPSVTFASMKREGGIARPMFFMILMGVMAGALSLTYYRLLPHPYTAPDQDPLQLLLAAVPVSGFTLLAIWFSALPFLLGLFALASSGVIHLSLMMFDAARFPFETTFRTFCYVMGSAYVFQLIPYVAEYIAPVWALACLCIGMARAHESSTAKASFGVILPVLLCCGCVLSLAALGGYASVMAAKGMR
jgi:hypothetical protein